MPQIALTFDDDPKVFFQGTVQLGTAELLRVIESLNQQWETQVRVTIFVVGINLEKILADRARVLTRLVEGGHEIGNHSYSHPQNFHKLPVDAALEEVGKTHDLVRMLFGRPPVYFRPPYGLIRSELKQAIAAEFQNYQTVGWDRHDEKDSYSHEQLRQVVVANAADKQVVLLHAWYQNTLWAMRGIFTDLHARGYAFSTLDELDIPPPQGGLVG